jgi:hypothetical protein
MREPRTEGRVIRKSLLESERWLTLKDNADRLAFLSLLLNCDDYGNYSAERFRLLRMWRDFGITTTALVSKCLAELESHEMIGIYEIDGRPFLHVFRLFNSKQWWWRSFPKSPFTDDIDNEKKQRVSELSIKPVSDQHKPGVRGKGIGEELKPARDVSPAVIKPDSVTLEVWADFLKVRKAKKAPLTDTALKGIAREAKKAGISLQDALQTCCMRGWIGFNASWITGVEEPQARRPSTKVAH